MQILNKSTTMLALVTVVLLSLGACAKREEPAPVAAMPPPPPPPPTTSPPSADEQIRNQLSQIGAKPTDGGYTVTLSSAKFRSGNVSFSSDEDVTLQKIADVLKANPHVRVQIENYSEKRGPKRRMEELAQEHAGAVLRNLISKGADEDRIQAQGRVDPATKPRVEITFSNAEGEFHPAPLENS